MSGGTGYGVTIQGFVLPLLTDIQTDLNQALQAEFGADINLSPQSFFGQISGIISERLELVWLAMQDVYNSQTPDTASGASLDNVGALRGIPRLQATFSVQLNEKLFGTAGTVIPSGTKFSVPNAPSGVFQTTAPVTLVAGQDCVQSILFSGTPVAGSWTLANAEASTGPLAFNISAATLQAAIRTLPFCSGCIVTGSVGSGFTVTFAGAGTGGLMVQPQFTATSTLVTITPSPVSVTTAIVTPGVDQASINLTATATGPIIANAGTLTNIVTPVSGLTNALNITDANVGTNVETDSAYRARMAQELQIAGASTVEAIRSRLLATTGVKSALVYENVDDVPDGDGRPAKSFECVVNGGTDADVAETIWLAKPAGIRTDGTITVPIIDSQGQSHDIRFSRPTLVPIYIIFNLLVNLNFPVDGPVLIQEIIANYINALNQGVSVIVDPYLVAQLASIPGIDYTTVLIGTAPGPTLSNNIPIAAFEQAFTQTDFIIVNTAPG